MLLFAFAGLLTYGHCQDVSVSVNNQDATTNPKQDCAYKINGICSTEDIGGVDVEIIDEDIDERGNTNVYAVFTNYNSSAVTVVYEIGNDYASDLKYMRGKPSADEKTGSISLQQNSSKRVLLHHDAYAHEYTLLYSIRGLIVRRIK